MWHISPSNLCSSALSFISYSCFARCCCCCGLRHTWQLSCDMSSLANWLILASCTIAWWSRKEWPSLGASCIPWFQLMVLIVEVRKVMWITLCDTVDFTIACQLWYCTWSSLDISSFQIENPFWRISRYCLANKTVKPKWFPKQVCFTPKRTTRYSQRCTLRKVLCLLVCEKCQT